MEFEIRRAEEKDIPAITDLEKVCFEGKDPWSYGAFYNEIVENSDKTLYLVALADGKVVGYMGVWMLPAGHWKPGWIMILP